MFRPGKVFEGCPKLELEDPELRESAIRARDEMVMTDTGIRGVQIDPMTPFAAQQAATECWAAKEEGLCVFTGAVTCKRVL
jgi:hypothetical protein